MKPELWNLRIDIKTKIRILTNEGKKVIKTTTEKKRKGFRRDYEKYTSIKAYIGMIARNKAKDKIRAIKNWDLELYEDVILIDNQAERLMEQKEQQRIIQKLLQQLKPVDREIFLLYYYRYLKIEEIALQLNMNPQTIKTRLRRGRETLRNALREEGYTVYENKD